MQNKVGGVCDSKVRYFYLWVHKYNTKHSIKHDIKHNNGLLRTINYT